METVFRYFPCDGRCGGYVQVPYYASLRLMNSNGSILPHEPMYCNACKKWFAYQVELIEFPNEPSSPPR